MRLSTSLSMLRATPGYWIFMAALRPSCRVAPCTCAQASHSPVAFLGSRPAPKGMSSKVEWAAQRMLQGGPVHLLMRLTLYRSLRVWVSNQGNQQQTRVRSLWSAARQPAALQACVMIRHCTKPSL